MNFGGNIKRIQWNNRIKVLLLSLSFFIGIFIFTTMWIGLFLSVGIAVDGWESVSSQLGLDGASQFKIVRVYLKIFAIVIGIYLFFLYRDLKNVGHVFDARPINLPAGDEFYKILEEFCIARGLRVPDLYVGNEGGAMPEDAITGVVTMDMSGKSSLIITPATYHLERPLLEAFLAQVVQRIYTKDTMFLTFFCFLGYFPYHLKRHSNVIFRFLAKPFLWVTDLLLVPVRRMVMNMSFARLDVGALELTKEKAPMDELLKRLAPLSVLDERYHTPFLTLFLVSSEDEYRRVMLKKA